MILRDRIVLVTEARCVFVAVCHLHDPFHNPSHMVIPSVNLDVRGTIPLESNPGHRFQRLHSFDAIPLLCLCGRYNT